MNNLNLEDFTEDDPFAQIRRQREEQERIDYGKYALWVLHACKFFVLLFSGYHNITASTLYVSKTSDIVFQAAGVLIVEAVIGGLYWAYMAGKLPDTKQQVMAFVVWSLGMFFSASGILAHNKLVNGTLIGGWPQMYMDTWIFLAPLAMVIGLTFVLMLDPIIRQQMAAKISQAKMQERMLKRERDAKELQANMALDLRGMQLKAQLKMVEGALKAAASENAQKLFLGRGAERANQMLNLGTGIGGGGDKTGITPVPNSDSYSGGTTMPSSAPRKPHHGQGHVKPRAAYLTKPSPANTNASQPIDESGIDPEMVSGNNDSQYQTNILPLGIDDRPRPKASQYKVGASRPGGQTNHIYGEQKPTPSTSSAPHNMQGRLINRKNTGSGGSPNPRSPQSD